LFKKEVHSLKTKVLWYFYLRNYKSLNI
jgi:hypothetical protein